MDFENKNPTWSDLSKALSLDLEVLKVNHKGGLWSLYYAFAIPAFRTVLVFRLSRYFYKKGGIGAHFGRFLCQLNMFLSSCEIAPEARIGNGLFLPHPTGIVIGAATIGERARILQHVTIGVRDSRDNEAVCDFPTLGTNVAVAAGAVILGKIRIGHNAVIGANSVVLKDVPDNATAVGIPARILTR